MSILLNQFDIKTMRAPLQGALKATSIETPLGLMLAIADDSWLYLLEFIDARGLLAEIESLKRKKNSLIYEDACQPLASIREEISCYFEGRLQHFKTPFQLFGSSFQQLVWHKLQSIPYGTTSSYLSLSRSLDKPKAYRAVANANGANRLCIIIPCHRIIRANGDLCGYGGHPYRKEWLLKLEKKHAS